MWADRDGKKVPRFKQDSDELEYSAAEREGIAALLKKMRASHKKEGPSPAKRSAPGLVSSLGVQSEAPEKKPKTEP